MARNKLKPKTSPIPTPSPAAQGYRIPAEWEPHEASWIAWPHRRSDWPGKLPPIPWVYGEIIRWLSTSENVHILVKDAAAERQATEVLKKVGVDFDAVQFW